MSIKRILSLNKLIDLRLNVQDNQAQKYKDFLSLTKDRKSKNININSDFFKKLKNDFQNFYEKKNEYEKSEMIENQVLENQKIIQKINGNIEKYKNSKNEIKKEKLFEELEQDILKLSKLIEILKKENQQLRKELELLIEKDQKSVEKNSFEKENKNLQEKIEAIKEKTQNSKNEFVNFSEKTENKITYKTKTIDENVKER